MLIRSLPLESATIAAMRGGDEFREWGLQSYLTTSLIDAVRENTYAVIMANSGKRKPKMPEPAYRPMDKKTTKKTAANNPFAARLAAARRAKAKARGV